MEQENARLKKLLAETIVDKEALNGKFRGECLDEHWFRFLEHTRAIIQSWRQGYNEHRPHSMLGYQTLAEAPNS